MSLAFAWECVCAAMPSPHTSESVELHNYGRTMGVNRIPLQNKRHPHMFTWLGFTAGLKSWQHHNCGQGWEGEGGKKCIFVCFRVSGSSSGAITSLRIRPKICVDVSQPRLWSGQEMWLATRPWVSEQGPFWTFPVDHLAGSEVEL